MVREPRMPGLSSEASFIKCFYYLYKYLSVDTRQLNSSNSTEIVSANVKMPTTDINVQDCVICT